MIGPPFLKLSIKKFDVKMPGFGVGAGVAAGLAVAATVGAGLIPGAGDSNVTGTDAPGLATGIVPGIAGEAIGAPGAAGVVIAGKVEAGLPIAGGAGVIAGGGASWEAGAVAVGD
jgi:hypothetical protein